MTVPSGPCHATHPSLSAAAQSFRSAAIAAFAGHSAKHLRRKAVNVFSKEPEVRFFLDGTRNLGHQASTLGLIQRFVELTRYSGSVLVLFADYGEPNLGSTREKIALLVPGMQPGTVESAEVACGRAKIRFVDFARRDQACKGRVRFGFSGGADNMAMNYARECNVDWFLRLQPFLWDDDAWLKRSPHYESSRLEAIDGRSIYLCDEFPEFSGLPLAQATVQLSVRSQRVERREDEPVRLGKLAIWPVYGLHHYPETAGQIALQVAVAGLVLSEKIARQVAVRCFNPPGTMSRWQDIPAALADDLAAGRFQLPRVAMALERNGIEGAFSKCLARKYASLLPSNAKLDIARQGSVSEATVVMMDCLPLPAGCFRQLMLSSCLPPILEGQTTANMLAVNGRPYLHLLRPGHTVASGYWKGPGDPSMGDACSHLEAMSRFLSAPAFERGNEWKPLTHDQFEEGMANLVEFCIQCVEAKGELQPYFPAIRTWLNEGWRDKLQIGLLPLLEIT